MVRQVVGLGEALDPIRSELLRSGARGPDMINPTPT